MDNSLEPTADSTFGSSRRIARSTSSGLIQGFWVIVPLTFLLIFSGAARTPESGTTGSGAKILDANPDQLDSNRKEIELMDLRQLNDLRARKSRFDKLPAAEKERLRQLHLALQSHSEKAQLEKIMLRYMDWLKSLDPLDQVVVLDKQGDERLGEVCRMRYQQSRQLTVLSPADNLEFIDWFRSVAETQKEAISEAVDRIGQRRRFRPEKSASPEALLRYVIATSDSETAKIVTPEVIGHLNSRLSARGREILEQGDSVRAIRMLITNPVSEFELRRFFEEKLSPMQRAELDRKEPDDMKRQIRRLYFSSQLGLAGERK